MYLHTRRSTTDFSICACGGVQLFRLSEGNQGDDRRDDTRLNVRGDDIVLMKVIKATHDCFRHFSHHLRFAGRLRRGPFRFVRVIQGGVGKQGILGARRVLRTLRGIDLYDSVRFRWRGVILKFSSSLQVVLYSRPSVLHRLLSGAFFIFPFNQWFAGTCLGIHFRLCSLPVYRLLFCYVF